MGGRGRRHDPLVRKQVLLLIGDARRRGARLEQAAQVLGLTSRTIQRWRGLNSGYDRRNGPRTPAHQLSLAERQQVLAVANAPEYRDLSPRQIVPRLADAGQYVASESTFYRILRAEKQLAHRERCRPVTHRRPKEKKATGPCQVWSWDITYLRSPVRGVYFYLYIIMDVWSRKIMAATVFSHERDQNSAWLFGEAIRRYAVDPLGLILHSDNGSAMKGATMLATLQKLGVMPSFSRPGVSNDNPFSESLFRTLKYRSEYPTQPFASEQQAQQWVDHFVQWYNSEHLHSEIRFVTPDTRHNGKEKSLLDHRKEVYESARKKNPGRWSQSTRNWEPVGAVILNPAPKIVLEEGQAQKAA